MRIPSPGELLAQRYEIIERLGRGAFGDVLRAHDRRLARDVAIKFLVPGPEGYAPDAKMRFEREARVVALLEHPNTVRLFEYGSTPDGLLYMVFEHISGRDLKDLSAHSALPSNVVRHILSQLLDAIREAHDKGVLHRDIKPANVIAFAHEGDQHRVKLLDFGIAKLAEPENKGGGLTRTGAAIGTPAYMAPEQTVGDPAVPQSDIYSVGILGLQLLCGEEFADLWKTHALEEFLTAPSAPPAKPPGVDGALLSALAKLARGSIEQRPATAVAALRILSQSDGPRRSVTSGAQLAPPQPRLRRGPLTISVLVGASLACAFWFFRAPPPEPRAPVVRRIVSAPQLPVVPEPVSSAEPDVGPAQDASTFAGFDCGVLDAGTDFVRMSPKADRCGLPHRYEAGEGYHRLDDGGREVVFYLPKSYRPNRRHPVVIIVHDQFDTPVKLLQTSKFADVADKYGFVIVGPRDRDMLTQWTRDDSDALPRSVRKVASEACLDLDNVFAFGQGRGGLVVEQAACQMESINAIATNAFRTLGAPCERPVPYLHIYGVDNPDTRPEGGTGCVAQMSGGFSIRENEPVALHDELWARTNCCSGQRTTYAPLKHDNCYTWDCDTTYVSCHLPGGRQWMNVDSWRRKDCSAPPTEFAIGEQLWTFFSAHRR